jgi:predicted DNA-binding transcriptional regulator AlpA
MLQRRLRYRDLEERGIIRNRITLKNWIKNRGFPAGQLTGPNSRTWTEAEVEAWIASRPTAPKRAPPRGRPRKNAEADIIPSSE